MGTITFIILVMFVISYIALGWKKIAFKNFEFKRSIDKMRVFPNEEITMYTEMVNRKFTPLSWIEVNCEVPISFDFKDQTTMELSNKRTLEYKVVTSLFSYQRVRRKNKFSCGKRGYYMIGNSIIKSGDYLGMAEAEIWHDHDIEIVVYPEVKPISTLLIQKNSPQGDLSVKRWILPDPMITVGVREYTSRDSFKDIDWKASARYSKLHVKRFDYTSEQSMMLYVDVQTADRLFDNGDEEAVDIAIDIAASICEEASKEKIAVGYATNGTIVGASYEHILPKHKVGQKMILFEAMARTSYYRAKPISEMIEKYSKYTSYDCTSVIITAKMTEEICLTINHMAKRGHKIKLILIKEDLRFKYDRRIEVLNYRDVFLKKEVV